ncbi:hypothetical protein ACH4Q7_22720 [Streptomyces roseolus]|uniref:hypothetical protein n=1 Tax=Streptomyces roseolus TaxID=67358 RepID=UPI0037932B11
MSHEIPNVHFDQYGPERFNEHTPFARRGYLFTVPGDFPADIPVHTRVGANLRMAVYRAHGEWEVRDVDGHRRVWATGPSRRVATGLALLEIARKRRIRAAEIADKRKAIGLEEKPPFTVEVTGEAMIACHAGGIAIVDRLLPSGNEPSRYVVRDVEGGDPFELRGGAVISETSVGVLHARCGCDVDGDQFENQADALAHAKLALTHVWPCPNNPA